jgi:hypothetical protein
MYRRVYYTVVVCGFTASDATGRPTSGCATLFATVCHAHFNLELELTYILYLAFFPSTILFSCLSTSMSNINNLAVLVSE